jgi:cation/acetate symporter
MRAAGQVVLPHTQAFVGPNQQFDLNRAINFFALIFCLMVGTASLPHILMRYFTTPSVREARSSVAWSLFFIFLLYFTAPAYAAFAKLEVYSNVIGQPIAQLPEWLKNWQLMSPYGVPWVGVNDANRDGILQLSEFRIHPDVIVLATPEIAGLPYVIAGLVAAGGLAAALSTADGLLLAIANALSHDIYYRMIDRHAPTGRRLVVARALLIAVAVVAAYTAGHLGADILFLVAWAFSIAAAGLFAALVMGVWYKRTTNAGAIAGMIVGYVITFGYLIWSEFFGLSLIELVGSKEAIIRAYQQYVGIAQISAEAKAPIQALLANQAAITDGPLHGWLLWATSSVARNRVGVQLWGINNISGGIFGVPMAFLVTYIVSQITTAPSKAMQDFIDSIRIPRGGVALVDKTQAVE